MPGRQCHLSKQARHVTFPVHFFFSNTQNTFTVAQFFLVAFCHVRSPVKCSRGPTYTYPNSRFLGVRTNIPSHSNPPHSLRRNSLSLFLQPIITPNSI